MRHAGCNSSRYYFLIVDRAGAPLPTLVFLLLIVCGSMVDAGSAVAGPGIAGVRHFTAPDHTRVVLDLTGPASFEVRRIGNPERLVVNVFGASFRQTGPIAVGDGLVRLIRRNPGDRRAQVVLDLDHKAEFRNFSLPAGDGRPHRIVLDVLRAEPENDSAALADALPQPVSKPAIALAPVPAPFMVIIDPGHGGLDPGASRKGLREKDVVLDISREMARLINALPGYRAVLTRNADYGLELWQRVDFARRKEGDLFISVHCNTHPRAAVSGMEVYFLSLQGATDREARELADKENAAQLVGLDPADRPDDLVMDILMDLRMSQVLHQSASLSERMVTAAKTSGVINGRKVKQAGFHVLKSLAMPSALVEVAYLSNAGDRKLLADRSARRKIAMVMVEGILDWRRGQQDRLQLATAPAKKVPDDDFSSWTREYKVRRGDNLWRLAQRHGTTVNEITQRNHLEDRSILVGQMLKLPEVQPDP
ncbi:MAG: N-acetylmuramoyl-L-alanine amidase [Candidatus Krumholzibacteriota bacterium]